MFLRTIKPLRIGVLIIILEDYRGPRKKLFILKILHSKGVGNNGVLQAKTTNFKGLVFILNTGKLVLQDLN